MVLPISSVQLYTLNTEFSADMSGLLDRLAVRGLRYVEAFGFVGRPTQIRAALDAAGLSSPTGHAPLLSDELGAPDGAIPTPAPEVVFEAPSTIQIVWAFETEQAQSLLSFDSALERHGVVEIHGTEGPTG